MTGGSPGAVGARSGATGAPRRARRGRPRAVRRGLLVAVAALALVVGAAAWLGVDVLRARTALEHARSDLAALEAQVRDGDEAGARVTVADLQARARVAARSTRGPVWALAARVPRVGPDVVALRTVSTVLDGLARDALPSLMAATRAVDPARLAPVDGAVDLAPLVAVAPEVTAADRELGAAAGALARIDTARLQPRVATTVERARAALDAAASTTSTAAKAVRLLPAMLGADGRTRDYLVLVQNNAEPRATGGIPGVVLHLRAHDGKVSEVDARSGGSLATASPALVLHDDERAIFGPLLGTDMRDVTFTPDFPRTGALAAAIWQQRVGGPVDGVLSVDPAALALVLRATGPVTLADGSTLDAQSAVRRLLDDVYTDLPQPAAQDAWFADAAGAVLHAVLGRGGDGPALVEQLSVAAREGRVLVWSAHPDEQSQLAATVLGGALAGQTRRTSVGPAGAVVGVFLNDGTAAKMGYYEDLTVTGGATSCHPDGSQDVHLDVTLANRAPADAATTLPAYVLGPDRFVPWGSVQTNLLLYAPRGGAIASVRLTPGPQGLFAQRHDGLTVGAVTSVLAPGQQRRFSVDVVTGPGQSGETVVRSTPTARQSGRVVLASACAGPGATAR